MISISDLLSVPSELVGSFSLAFYSSPEDVVYKVKGVNENE